MELLTLNANLSISLRLSAKELHLFIAALSNAEQFVTPAIAYTQNVTPDRGKAEYIQQRFLEASKRSHRMPANERVETSPNEFDEVQFELITSDELTVQMTSHVLLIVLNSLRAVVQRIPDELYHTVVGSEKDFALQLIRDLASMQNVSRSSECPDLSVPNEQRQRAWAVILQTGEHEEGVAVRVVAVLPTLLEAQSLLGQIQQDRTVTAPAPTIQATWWLPDGINPIIDDDPAKA